MNNVPIGLSRRLNVILYVNEPLVHAHGQLSDNSFILCQHIFNGLALRASAF